jgi:ribA/ribD-fused uncharacterized protein
MGLPEVISYFDTFEGDNEWAALSNFWQGEPIRFGQYVFATGEHFFQAMKATSRRDFMKVVASATPGEARANGLHMLRLRPDWERVKYDVMRLVLAHKFAPGREEAAVLLATGDALLVEGTTWGDQTWGVDLKAGRKLTTRREDATGKLIEAPWEPGEPWEFSPGRNWLGVLLMARRAELVAALKGNAFDYTEVAAFAKWTPPTPN